MKTRQRLILYSLAVVVFQAVSVYLTLRSIESFERLFSQEFNIRSTSQHLSGVLFQSSKFRELPIGLGSAAVLTELNDISLKLREHIKVLRSLVCDPEEVDALEEIGAEAGRVSSKLRQLLAREARAGKDGIDYCRDEIQEIVSPLNSLVVNKYSLILKNESTRASGRRPSEFESAGGLRNEVLFVFLVSTVCSLGVLFAFFYETKCRIDSLAGKIQKFRSFLDAQNPSGEDNEIAELERLFFNSANELRKRAALTEEMLDNSSDVICSINSSLEFCFVSSAAISVWGMRPKDLVQCQIADIVVEEDRGMFVGKMTEISSYTQTCISRIEARIKPANGVERYTVWQCRWSPSQQSIFAVVHDISERRRLEEEIRASERRIRELLDVLPVGVVLSDDRGSVEYINGAIEKMMASIGGRAGSRNVQDFLELSQASISQQISDIPIETSLKGVNDERLPVEVSAHSVNVNKKNCWIILVNDIRDRIEVRRIRQNFVAIVSHDLRTPLTAIMSHLDLMASGVYGEINEKGLERLSTACRSVERLLSLVNDLLDLEKLESGGIEVECQKIAIEDVVLDTVSSLHELSSSKSITVKYQPIDTYVFADRSRLGQIMQNLLSNAIKFSPSGSKVLISEEICGDFVKIKIDDSGPGIPANKRFVVFEKFQQLEKSVRRRGHGSGLGLTIAKELVEKHGGNIGVTDSVLGGSCFWFTLRRQAPPSLPV